MNILEYGDCDAVELASLVSSRQVDPVELRDVALRAIESAQPSLNAVVHGPYDDVPAPPGSAPLAGVPFAVKDTLPEAGRPWELGSRLLAGFTAPRDATLTERFRAAGLVSLARTALPEFGINVDTAPVTHGPTRNPWRLDRSPGGSSGGSAALVAARAVPVAHANDGGGSIRIPAAWCGLVGLKPSRGRVPLGPEVGETWAGLAHEFALTRTVRDAAALLDAVSGPAPGDRYYVEKPSVPFLAGLDAEAPQLRIAVHTGAFGGVKPTSAVRAATEGTARTLESLGHHVEEACGRLREDELDSIFGTVFSAELANMATTLAPLTGRTVGPDTVEAASLAGIRDGLELPAVAWTTAMAAANRMSRSWGRFLDEYDLFVCPTTPGTAPPSGTPAQDDERFDTMSAWLREALPHATYAAVANVTGQPAISLPLAVDGDGLPVGVMLTAQTLREGLLLQVAAQLEQTLPWADREPSLP